MLLLSVKFFSWNFYLEFLFLGKPGLTVLNCSQNYSPCFILVPTGREHGHIELKKKRLIREQSRVSGTQSRPDSMAYFCGKPFQAIPAYMASSFFCIPLKLLSVIVIGHFILLCFVSSLSALLRNFLKSTIHHIRLQIPTLILSYASLKEAVGIVGRVQLGSQRDFGSNLDSSYWMDSPRPHPYPQCPHLKNKR